VAEITHALELDGNYELAGKVRAAAKKSPQEAIRVLLYEWRDDPPGTNPHNLAYLSTYLNDADQAIYWLDRSIAEHHPWSTWIAAAPEFQVLRDDQRFGELLKKMNLE
jgi:hypothetical protein